LTSPNPKPTVSAPANGALLRQARSAQQEGDRGGALRLLRRAAGVFGIGKKRGSGEGAGDKWRPRDETDERAPAP